MQLSGRGRRLLEVGRGRHGASERPQRGAAPLSGLRAAGRRWLVGGTSGGRTGARHPRGVEPGSQRDGSNRRVQSCGRVGSQVTERTPEYPEESVCFSVQTSGAEHKNRPSTLGHKEETSVFQHGCQRRPKTLAVPPPSIVSRGWGGDVGHWCRRCLFTSWLSQSFHLAGGPADNRCGDGSRLLRRSRGQFGDWFEEEAPAPGICPTTEGQSVLLVSSGSHVGKWWISGFDLLY